jgi:DNA-binding winged helix-turn-helix (wHTH) protein/Tol biopolymer transport system component
MTDLPTIYEFANFRADTLNKTLIKAGEILPLTPKVFDTLIILLENAPNLIEKDVLMEKIWHDRFVEESNLTFNIKMLRKALGDDASSPQFIENVPRRGYRFIAEVKTVSEQNSSTKIESLESTVISESDSNSIQKSKTLYYLAGVGAVLLLLFAGFTFFYRNRNFKFRKAFEQINTARITSTGKAFYAIVSPDGKYIIHTQSDGEKQSLLIRQTDQTRDIEIVPATEGQIIGVSVSPDSKSVFYTLVQDEKADAILYQVPILGGASKQIISNIDSGISFSADGNEFVFYRTNQSQGLSQLMMSKLDGTSQKVVAERKFPETFATEFGNPVWKTNERKILAIASLNLPDGKSDVVEIAIETGEIKPFFKAEWRDIQQIAWLKNTASLLLVAFDEESNSRQIFHIDSNGKYRKVTSDLNNYRGISLTDDEKTLITTQTGQITKLSKTNDKTAATSEEILSEDGNVTGNEGLTWANDNSLIVSFGPHLNDNIHIIDQSGLRPLTVDLNGNRQPTFCSDKIVFAMNFVATEPNKIRLVKMDKDGKNAQKLTTEDSENEMFPHCSPKSDWVVYQRGWEKTMLWKAPIAGGKSVQLTDYSSFQPTISPDGKMVAFYHSDNFKWSINVVSIEDGKLLKQFPISGKIKFRHLRWTPDGKNLAYSGTRKNVSNIWLQSLDGSEAKQLTSFDSGLIYYFDWSPDGKNLAYTHGTITSDVFTITDVR